MSTAHPGFKAVQAKIAAKEGVSKKAAGAILAKSSRNASAKAKKKNLRLLKVRGNPRSQRKAYMQSKVLNAIS